MAKGSQGSQGPMATDRGTLPRGPLTSTGQRTAPAAGRGGRRPPGAPRERKMMLAALAALLVAGGAAASGLLMIKTSHRVAAIEISKEIGAGQPIPASALQEVQVSADSGLSYVAWGERSQVTQYYANGPIPPGTLLTARMVIRATSLTTGRELLGLTLKPGQVPGNLQIGDHVDIYDTSVSSNQCPGIPGGTLTHDAIVTNLILPSGSGGNPNVAVDVALNPADAGQVACAAANDYAAIGILPSGGQLPQPSASPSPTGVQPSVPGRTGGKRRHGLAPTPSAPASPTAPAVPGTG